MNKDNKTTQNVSAGNNATIVQAGRDAILQVKKSPPDIKLIRLSIEDNIVNAGQKQKLNIIMKNNGDTTAFLMRGHLFVVGSEHITNCNHLHTRYSLSKSDWTYDLNINDPNASFLGKHSIAPNEVVNFDVDVARDRGEAEISVYKCNLKFEFDEDQELETGSFYLEISGPTSIGGFFTPHGPTEEEWGRCQVDNIRRLARIGYDFRSTIQKDSRKYVETIAPGIFDEIIVK